MNVTFGIEVRSLRLPLIPAQAGIQGPYARCITPWVPAFAGASGGMDYATPSFFCRLVDDVVY
jgi:hypothetical protein